MSGYPRPDPWCSLRGLCAILVGVVSTGCVVYEDDFSASAGEVHPVAQRYCELFSECGCTLNPFAYTSIEDCETEVGPRFGDLVRAGEAFGLTYDFACEAFFIEALGDEGCRWPPKTGCDKPCRLYHGDEELGARCQAAVGGMSDCAQGLSCDGVCYDPCQRELDDESSLLADAEPCSGHSQCESSYCPRGYCLPPEACPATPCPAGRKCEQGVCVPTTNPLCLTAFP